MELLPSLPLLVPFPWPWESLTLEPVSSYSTRPTMIEQRGAPDGPSLLNHRSLLQ